VTMASLQFDLTAPNVWEQVYDGTIAAQQPAPGIFIPIPRISIPIILHERVIVVGTSSMNARPNWRFSGTLSQRLVLPSLGSGLVDGHKQTLRINALSLIVLPILTPDYRLEYDVFHWIRDISLSVWRYVGEDQDALTELIETVKVDVIRVESKLDKLSPISPLFTDRIPNDLDDSP
jgi:hypothetical protein